MIAPTAGARKGFQRGKCTEGRKDENRSMAPHFIAESRLR